VAYIATADNYILTTPIYRTLSSHVRTSTMQRHAFSLVASVSGIHFPHRFDCYERATRLCSISCLKLIFFTVFGLGAPLSRFLEGHYINFRNE